MNLLDLMSQDGGRDEKSLDRLDAMVALYESEDEAEQREALERAIVFCEREWGSYQDGMERLARRVEKRAADPVQGAMDSLRLINEGSDPGSILRAVRARREAEHKLTGERGAVIARYGSEQAAKAPSEREWKYVHATRPYTKPTKDGNPDPWAVLNGWKVAWHEMSGAIRDTVAAVEPMPATVAEAEAEWRGWEARRVEYGILFETGAEATLPSGCAARAKVVEGLWKDKLPVASPADFASRLAWWSERGGDDGAGYGVLAADFQALLVKGVALKQGDSTKDKARRLKAENPGWSLARIGEVLGISRQAVHKHLKD